MLFGGVIAQHLLQTHNFRIGDRLTLDFKVPQLRVYGLDDKRRNA